MPDNGNGVGVGKLFGDVWGSLNVTGVHRTLTVPSVTGLAATRIWMLGVPMDGGGGYGGYGGTDIA